MLPRDARNAKNTPDITNIQRVSFLKFFVCQKRDQVDTRIFSITGFNLINDNVHKAHFQCRSFNTFCCHNLSVLLLHKLTRNLMKGTMLWEPITSKDSSLWDESQAKANPQLSNRPQTTNLLGNGQGRD